MKKIVWILALTLTGCVAPKQLKYFSEGTMPQHITTEISDPIAVGDELLVSVTAANAAAVAPFNLPLMGNADGTYNCRVRQDGTIALPSLSPIRVVGMSEQQLMDTLTQILSHEVQKPVVVLQRIGQYVTVLGEVHSPGRKAIVEPISIPEVIGMAGDISTNGKRDDIVVIRREGNEMKQYHINLLSQDAFSSPCYMLRKGDIVLVAPKFSKKVR